MTHFDLCQTKTNCLSKRLVPQRLGNILPGLISHANFESSAKVGQYTIPKGCIVQAYMKNIFFKDKIFPDAANFKPERFLTADGKSIEEPREFIPFSIGRRRCPGETLAKAQLFLITAILLQKFEFSCTNSHKPPCSAPLAGFTQSPMAFQAVVKMTPELGLQLLLLCSEEYH